MADGGMPARLTGLVVHEDGPAVLNGGELIREGNEGAHVLKRIARDEIEDIRGAEVFGVGAGDGRQPLGTRHGLGAVGALY
jgi:hypothetical protein